MHAWKIVRYPKWLYHSFRITWNLDPTAGVIILIFGINVVSSLWPQVCLPKRRFFPCHGYVAFLKHADPTNKPSFHLWCVVSDIANQLYYNAAIELSRSNAIATSLLYGYLIQWNRGNLSHVGLWRAALTFRQSPLSLMPWSIIISP